MTKSDYIRAISKRGSRNGRDGGAADLLDFYGKDNTQEITEEEARAFLEIDYKEAQQCQSYA